MFLLTVVFGLFHGLVYLPVVLSIMGPLTSHDDSDTDSNSGSSSVMTDSTNGNFKDHKSLNTSGLINDGYVHDEVCLTRLLSYHSSHFFPHLESLCGTWAFSSSRKRMVSFSIIFFGTRFFVHLFVALLLPLSHSLMFFRLANAGWNMERSKIWHC